MLSSIITYRYIILFKFSLELVESIPTGMVYPNTAPRHRSTYNAWTELLRRAEKSVDIVAVYWNMRDKTGYKTAWQGEEVFNLLIETAKRGVKIRVAQNSANSEFGPLDDLDYLEKQGLYCNDDSKSKCTFY
jgi:hypothetical protein